MGAMILFIFYGSILFFVIATALRVKKCVNAPVHLHWELYQGSSIYELQEWWTKTHSRFAAKVWSMILDILSLREFYHRNRRFWYPLLIFHMGLYLLIFWHLWLFIRAVVASAETASSFGWIWGIGATAMTFIGGAMILWMRVTDKELKVYYPPIHYVKWVFLLVTLLGGIYAVDLHFKSSVPALLKYVREQVTFADLEHKLHPALAPALHVLFASVWLIYLPFGHVFQLFFRYYHHLRWDDVPNKRGGMIERRVKELLERPVTWSAPHIQSGRPWRGVASEFPQPPVAGSK
jgi:nitrate reductase gamma subunit